MFETIGTLFTIAFWAVAIFFFIAGILMSLACLFGGDGLEKFGGILAIILGVIAFSLMYDWIPSIPWCMLVSGVVASIVTIWFDKSPQKKPAAPAPKEKKYGIGQAFLDAYIEEKVIEEAVSNAIKKSKE